MLLRTLWIIALAVLLCACSPVSSEHVSGHDQASTEQEAIQTEQTLENDNTVPEVLGHYDIVFNYENNIYDYGLEARWYNVIIKPETAYEGERTSEATAMGFEILLDGTMALFEEMDTDVSGNVTADEWGDLEGDFPFGNVDVDGDGSLNFNDFSDFTARFLGMDLYADSYVIMDPQEEDYAIADEGGASLKILRAAEGGAYIEGFMGHASFPEGTIFVELCGDFSIYAKGHPEMEMGPGFTIPLLSMLIEQDFEKANGGALGFSSIVDSKDFNQLFTGGSFSLHYEGKYQGDTMDIYDLTITPTKK